MKTTVVDRLRGAVPALVLLLLLHLLGGCGGQSRLSLETATSNDENKFFDTNEARPMPQVEEPVVCAAPHQDGSCAPSEGALCCPVRAYRYVSDAGCWQDAGVTHDTLACVSSVAVGGTPDVCYGSGVYDCFERWDGGLQEVIVTTYMPGEGDASMTSLGYIRCSTTTRDTVIKGGDCANYAQTPED